MPVIHWLSSSKAKLCMYADDEAPLHVHLLYPDGAAKIDLRTFQVMRGDAPAALVAEATDWLRLNIQAVWTKWRELNDRD